MTIVYPADTDPSNNKISVLSPVGAAFTGESEGTEVELSSARPNAPNQDHERLCQPEAQGHFAL